MLEMARFSLFFVVAPATRESAVGSVPRGRRAGSALGPRQDAAKQSTLPPQAVHKSYTCHHPYPNILWGSYLADHQILWFWG